MNNTGQQIVKHKVQHAEDINNLRKIGLIAATEQQTHVDRAQTIELFFPLWVDRFERHGIADGKLHSLNIKG